VLRCNPWNEGGFDPAPPAPEAPRRKIGDEKGGL
jgi:putative component of membrane protein insertase Oxa1/YidC/SpoIIIJ protein YidD